MSARAWGWLTEAGIVADWRDDAQSGPLAGMLSEAEARQIAGRAGAGLEGPVLPLDAVLGDPRQLRFELGGELVALVELHDGRAQLTAPAYAAPPADVAEGAERALREHGAIIINCAVCTARVAAVVDDRLVALSGVVATDGARGRCLLCAVCSEGRA